MRSKKTNSTPWTWEELAQQAWKIALQCAENARKTNRDFTFDSLTRRWAHELNQTDLEYFQFKILEYADDSLLHFTDTNDPLLDATIDGIYLTTPLPPPNTKEGRTQLFFLLLGLQNYMQQHSEATLCEATL